MTWPTADIPTTHLDSGSDVPTLARSAIKTMADSVNSMATAIDPTGATQGQALYYNGTKIVPIGVASIIGTYPVMTAVLGVGNPSSEQNTNFKFGSDTYSLKVNISEVSDPNGIIAVASNNVTLTAGTYVFRQASQYGYQGTGLTVRTANKGTPTDPVADLISTTASTFTGTLGGNSYWLTPNLSFVRVVNTTETLSFWSGQTGQNLDIGDLLVIKVA
jgi:hypothetical protein